MTKSLLLFIVGTLALLAWSAHGFQAPHTPRPEKIQQSVGSPLSSAIPTRDDDNDDRVSRRRAFLKTVFAAAMASLTVSSSAPILPAMAQDNDASEGGDLTSRMFNADGSLKEGIESEAKFRTVTMSIDQGEERVICRDGVSPSKKGKEASSSLVTISYQLPMKWEDGDNLYFDRSEGVNAKACNQILVYQAPGKVPVSQLEKATRIGIAKALDITDDLAEVREADLIGGSTTKVEDQKYFQFDLGVAPKTCADSPDNLGLGFCPFESVYLLSGTVVDDRLYVFAIQCSKNEWKRANADLRRVRSTFSVRSDGALA